jgi:hypothetical protein
VDLNKNPPLTQQSRQTEQLELGPSDLTCADHE